MTLPGPRLPTPPGHWLLGNQADYARDPLRSFRRWSAEHGDAIRLRFGPVGMLLLTSPAAVEELAVHHAADFQKAPIIRRLSAPVIGDSLFTAEGISWERQRELLEPAFSAERAHAAHDVIAGAANAMAGRWRDGTEIDILDESMRLSQQIVARLLFGTSFPVDDVDAVGRALTETARDFQRWVNSPWSALPSWVPLPRSRSWHEAVRTLDSVVARAIAGRRRQSTRQHDLLGHMLDLQPTAPWLTDRLVGDNVLMLLVQGREDPALLASWALYLLARDPDAATRAANEARAPGADGGAWTTAVLNETLRLYPPVYATGRQAIRHSTVAGIPVRRGTIVLTSQAVLHRDPRWFDDPDTFRPERWLDGLAERLPAGAFAPFGLGARACLGKHVARSIGAAIVGAVMRKWQIELADDTPVEPMVVLSLRPARPIRLRLSHRAH
jgi:cytochrome P450